MRLGYRGDTGRRGAGTPRAAAVTALAAGLAGSLPLPPAGAVARDDAARPRPLAAVIVAGPAADDRFVGAFLSAVLGEALSTRGVGYRAPRAAAEQLAELGAGHDCVADEACARRLARAVGSPLLVVVDARRARRRGLVVEGSVVVVDEASVTPVARLRARGVEARVARRLDAALAPVADAPLPCTVVVRGPAAPDATLTLDGAPAPPAPWFPPPGAHDVVAEAPDRPPAALRFACEAGSRLALEVE